MMFDFSWWPARKNKQLAEVRWKVRVEQEEKSNAYPTPPRLSHASHGCNSRYLSCSGEPAVQYIILSP